MIEVNRYECHFKTDMLDQLVPIILFPTHNPSKVTLSKICLHEDCHCNDCRLGKFENGHSCGTYQLGSETLHNLLEALDRLKAR
jgi:hypothetical protein